MSKHTPGPWELECRFDLGQKITSKARGNVCKVLLYDDTPKDFEQAKVDAHLISAAPEMFEALEAIVDSFHINVITSCSTEDFPALHKCVEALRKVKGM